MSLINDALKKAQRARTADLQADAPPMPGGSHPARGSAPKSSQTLLILGAGAAVLVVLSVVATVFLITRKPAPAAVSASPARPAASAPSAAIATTEIKVPLAPANPPSNPAADRSAPSGVAPKPATPRVAEKSDPAAAAPSPVQIERPLKPEAPPPHQPAGRVAETAPTAPPPVVTGLPAHETKTVAAAPAVVTPVAAGPAVAATLPGAAAPAATTPSATIPKEDERIHKFVDNVRVTGVRSSGGESRVLMNDKVYRVNDIVDRTLGLRLTKVEPDCLTFTDSNGLTYTKNF
ncbi:MAG: hypothetical protein HZA93_03375 [Verrucomicrobia bacterium]|nr:hypothetical protein [Verrucomicrobiota bacterium]